jgi:hypothetical protein
MASASHTATDTNVYPISFDIIGIVGPRITVNCPRAAGAALAPQGLLVLIGRDLLANANLFYNGPAGQFTLAF